MTDVEVISKALILMKKECSKYTTYSACSICPFGEVCRNGIWKMTSTDLNMIVDKYIGTNMH